MILMFSSLLEFCFGEQFPSVSIFPFVSFISCSETTVYYAMPQQKCFSKKMYLPFKQCLHKWRRRKTSSSWNRGLSGRLQFHRKRSALHKGKQHKGKETNNTKKAAEESSELRHSLLPSFISATKKQKQQPLRPKGSLSITDSFQKAFYIPSSLLMVSRASRLFYCL